MLTNDSREYTVPSKSVLWEKCLSSLQQELPSQQYTTWIRPLKVDIDGQQSGSVSSLSPLSELRLLAPNRFISDWVRDKFLQRICELVDHYSQLSGFNQRFKVAVDTVTGKQQGFEYTVGDTSRVDVEHHKHPASITTLEDDPLYESVGANGQTHTHHVEPTINRLRQDTRSVEKFTSRAPTKTAPRMSVHPDGAGALKHRSGLNENFTFNNFVEGKSNQMGYAAAMQIAENPGGAYNPLFIYGGVGLGKTHLMHAVGNELAKRNNNAKIVYLHSERFVADMVKALQLNAINDFKRYYRSVDALLIDDIQFFAGKDRSQEEFFHTFNALLEGNQQIILTCDRYPKVINNLEDRLKSRFGWGLTVEVEPPELETRVAILIKKAEEVEVDLAHDAAFFIAQRIRSNVRELEGALKRVIANAKFTGRPISIDLVREALKDLLALQDKQVSIHNIQRVVGDYYKVKIGDFISKRRSRSVARPRQVAMSLAKELTNYSLPEIGDAFGGRDHTTVLHACRKIKELCDTNADMQQDLKNLQRLLTT